jgi:tRNA nucleotidyltransferase (CCA-adding enzyme)
VKEFFDALPGFHGRVTVYDHHGAAGAHEAFDPGRPLAAVEIHHRSLGANASFLSILLMERGEQLSPEEATIALAGIFSDTGSFGHENVTPEDFTAARWLLEQGASLPLVKKFASSLYDEELTRVMHELVVNMETLPVNGQLVMVGEIALEHQPAGLAMLVERIFDLEHADAIFCVFALRKEQSHLIVARSSGSGVDVAFLLAHFGGGGHSQSASALVKHSAGVPILEHLKRSLALRLKPSVTARELMSPQPDCLREDMSLLEAALALESGNRSAAPVLDAEGHLSGMLSLKEIQKGRKGGKMATPVKAWMARDFLTVSPGTSLREIERIFFQEETSRLPVVEAGRVLGLVCRSDYLALVRGGKA